MDETALAALHTEAMQALSQVADPEVGESIVALGLVERLTLSQGRAELILLPTSATCPMADQLIDDAGCALERLCPEGWVIEVDMDWDGIWTPERMAPELRARFGWEGHP